MKEILEMMEQIIKADREIFQGGETNKTKGLLAMYFEIKQYVEQSEQKKLLTIGDKIRESNESLAEVIECASCCQYCKLQDTECSLDDRNCKSNILDYLNQPYTEVDNSKEM